MRLIRKRNLWWKVKDAMIIIAIFILIGIVFALIISVSIVTINLFQNLF